MAPNHGKLLQILARSLGACRILEIGTLGGYSTIWLARALPADGRLVTLEANPKHADVARRNIANAGLSDIVDLRVGPALGSLIIVDNVVRHGAVADAQCGAAQTAIDVFRVRNSRKRFPLLGQVISCRPT